MTLPEKQKLFTRLIVKLINFAHENDYEIVCGDFHRSAEDAARNAAAGTGIKNSLHTICLAADLNLFRYGKYLTDSADHKPLGDYWKTLHPLCRWGGDFKDASGKPKPDGGHYSIEHEGVK